MALVLSIQKSLLIGIRRGWVKPGCSGLLCKRSNTRLQGFVCATKYCGESIYINIANLGDGNYMRKLVDADDRKP